MAVQRTLYHTDGDEKLEHKALDNTQMLGRFIESVERDMQLVRKKE